MLNTIDLHCDTMPAMLGMTQKGKHPAIEKNDLQIDLTKLEKGEFMLQCFSTYTNLEEVKSRGKKPFEHVMELAAFWHMQIEAHPDRIRQVRTYQDIKRNSEKGIISALMTVEEGGVYEGKIDNLHRLFDEGARMSTLTWNFENELAFPNPTVPVGDARIPDMENGLKPWGYIFIEEMQTLGMIIDLAHLNDAGIKNVLDTVKVPVISSHSNCRSLCSHLRNLTDENIRRIAEGGGVIGVNFYPAFLRDDSYDPESGRQRASVKDMVRHMQHMKQVGGIECVALGSDHDGYDGLSEIRTASDFGILADAMSAGGFTSSEIEKIFYQNALRVMKDVLK